MTSTSSIQKPYLPIAVSLVIWSVSILNLAQTSASQWSTRPDIICDNGQAVHRHAEVNADRVNIRDLPTVFSNVLTQKNRPDAVTVVCEFGVWSRVELLEIAPETWISTGLITLKPDQPLLHRERSVLVGLFIVGMLGSLIGLYRPQWITKSSDLLLQTQHLPPHARPLISTTPQYHPARDSAHGSR